MTRGLDDVSCPGGKGESGRPSRYTPDKMSPEGGYSRNIWVEVSC